MDNSEASQNSARRFLLVMGWVGLIVVIGVAVINITIDPYLVFNMPRLHWINGRKPAIDSQERLMKSYDVLRWAPRTIILGSSRVDIGIPAASGPWPVADRPVYNLGLFGSVPDVWYRFLQHAMGESQPKLVVIGLDFEDFMAWSLPNKAQQLPDFDAHVSAREYTRVALSFDALADSLATLRANWRSDSSDIVAGNWDPGEFRRLTAPRRRPLVDRVDWQFADGLESVGAKHIDDLSMQQLQRIVDLCESRGIEVILFINPLHADRLEIARQMGYWGVFEEWQRRLVALTVTYSGDHPSRVSLWDFTAYDYHTTEDLRADASDPEWYWEPTHYKARLGAEIIARIRGGGDGSFGVLLTPANLESHLQTIRDQQRVYREHHSENVQRMRRLCAAVVDRHGVN